MSGYEKDYEKRSILCNIG